MRWGEVTQVATQAAFTGRSTLIVSTCAARSRPGHPLLRVADALLPEVDHQVRVGGGVPGLPQERRDLAPVIRRMVHDVPDQAREWVDEHISTERTEWAGGIVIEPRYVAPILEHIVADGMVIA